MAAGGALAGMLVARNLALLKEGVAAATASWGALAGNGLELGTDPQVLALGPEHLPPRLDGRVDGVAVAVRVVADAVYCATTQVTAMPLAPSFAEVSVHPNQGGLLGRVRAWLGQDVEVGDPAFDEPFLVLSRPREAAAELVDADARRAIAALAAQGFNGLHRDRDRVLVVLAGVQSDAEVVRVAIDVAVSVARRG